MPVARRKLLAGNWKMNGSRSGALTLAQGIADYVRTGSGRGDVLVCPPFTLIARIAEVVAGSGVLVGAQDCHAAAKGAHTGDVAAEMLAEAGASWVIVGHSERRAGHGEDNALVRRKAEAAHRAGIGAIVCIGETLAEREAGQTLDVLGGQIANSVPQGATAASTVIAYEPVWAIGTGKTPTEAEVAAAHLHIRRVLGSVTPDAPTIRILYGGSVNAANAASLLAVEDVDGALVGGASLEVDSFAAIIAAAG